MGMPEWIEPMAATLTEERFAGPDWLFERKFDGIRLLAFKKGRQVKLYSRNRLEQNCPPVAEAIAKLPVREAILDGEITWPGERLTYHVFDILWLDGRDLTGLPLEERRAELQKLPFAAPLHHVEEIRGEAPWDRACREGWEGVIAKQRGSVYEHRRSPRWLKMKCEEAQEFVIGGFTDPQGGRVGLGALLVGYYERGKFVFAGKVGTGFDTKLLVELRNRLDRIERPTPPFAEKKGLPRLRAHWVEPEVVAQIAFLEWTEHGKLRHSRFLHLREDKAASDVVRESRNKKGAGGQGPGISGALRAAGGTVTISHPEKVLFPGDGITKGELAAYYEAIAPAMLPHLAGRPITMERYHRGIGEKGFFQKDVVKGFPEWLERVEVPKKGGTVHHPIARDTRALVWMANQNSITPHVWTSRTPELMRPDVCVFDLDPMVDDAGAVRDAALRLRDLLEELALECWVKTSGSKGFHIVVSLDGAAEFGEVARFAGTVGRRLVERDPEHLTQEFAKTDRGGRILVDTGRNAYSATFAAAYAVRARPEAPVSAPCRWEEVERGEIGPRSFTLRNMAARMKAAGELWSQMAERKQSIDRAMERLRGATA